jgi:hypothetical protein
MNRTSPLQLILKVLAEETDDFEFLVKPFFRLLVGWHFWMVVEWHWLLVG